MRYEGVQYLHEGSVVREAETNGDHRGSSTLQTADRALQVLQLYAASSESFSVTEIAQRLGLHRSTASRLVATLERRRFLEREGPGDRLRLGRELARLGRIVLAGRDVVAVSEPILRRLAEETGENATLSVPAGPAVVTVAQATGRHFVSSGNWIGVRSLPHCCSDGKVLLAFGALPRPAGPLPGYTPATITDGAALESELDRTRARGYALAEGEMEDGLVGIAVPVRDGGACIAAACVSGPAYRLDRETVTSFVPACLRAAADIEAELGSAASPRPAVAAA